MDSNGNVLSVDFTHRLGTYQQRYVMKTEIYETTEAKSLRPASQNTDALPVCLADKPKTNKYYCFNIIYYCYF